MIYRAYDCAIFDNPREPATTVWFEAHSRSHVTDRLQTLLALTWQVGPDRICVGNVYSELEIEDNSVQERNAGDRRWIEGGSHGDRPSYYAGPTLVFLCAEQRRRLAAAAAAAKRHAQKIADSLVTEATGLPAGSRSAEDAAYEIEQYRRFALAPWLSEGDA